MLNYVCTFEPCAREAGKLGLHSAAARVPAAPVARPQRAVACAVSTILATPCPMQLVNRMLYRSRQRGFLELDLLVVSRACTLPSSLGLCRPPTLAAAPRQQGFTLHAQAPPTRRACGRSVRCRA
jgi:hypothetical protein